MTISDPKQMSDPELKRAFDAHMAAVNSPPARHHYEPFSGLERTGMPATDELGQAERRAVLGVLPRKSLWPELQEFDERVEALQTRQLEVERRSRELREQRVNAPSMDAQASADWEIAGREGPRPEPSVDRLDQAIADVDRERDGLLAAVDRALEDRAGFVEKNRDRLVNVASQQCEATLERIVGLIDEVERARATLAELRQAELWARLFPNELADREPVTRMFGGGLRQIGEPLGITAQIEYARLVEALRVDARWLRDAAASSEQRAALEGRDRRVSRDAAWADSDEYKAERRAEIDAAVEAFEFEWGRKPTEAQLVSFIQSRNGLVG